MKLEKKRLIDTVATRPKLFLGDMTVARNFASLNAKATKAGAGIRKNISPTPSSIMTFHQRDGIIQP
jgi:hypothetical protein